jgi:hypothetical protein
MHEEEAIGLYEDMFYKEYTRRIQDIKSWVIKKIDECIEDGLTMVAYGAAAKGMTMLNYFDIRCLSYIVDDAPLKHFKYTPGTNTIIYPISMLAEDKDDDICIIILAWNFESEIISKVKKLRQEANDNGRRTMVMQVFPQQKIYII